MNVVKKPWWWFRGGFWGMLFVFIDCLGRSRTFAWGSDEVNLGRVLWSVKNVRGCGETKHESFRRYWNRDFPHWCLPYFSRPFPCSNSALKTVDISNRPYQNLEPWANWLISFKWSSICNIVHFYRFCLKTNLTYPLVCFENALDFLFELLWCF